MMEQATYQTKLDAICLPGVNHFNFKTKNPNTKSTSSIMPNISIS